MRAEFRSQKSPCLCARACPADSWREPPTRALPGLSLEAAVLGSCLRQERCLGDWRASHPSFAYRRQDFVLTTVFPTTPQG